MFQEILLNYTFNQEVILFTRKDWIRKCTNEFVTTDNSLYFREVRN